MVLSTNRFPPDRRVEREARDLIRDGHQVYLMARRIPGQPREECIDGINVIRVELPCQWKKAISDLIYFFFQRYFMFFLILYACWKYRIDALHVHDLPYAFAATLAGKVAGLPIVFDMHEHYTEMLQHSFKAKTYQKFKPFAIILLSLLNLEERFACRWSDKIIVVAREHIPRIVSLNKSPEDIIEITNTDDIDYFSGLQIDASIVEQYKDDFVILYTGAICPLRGLDTAVRSMPLIIKEIPRAKLLIVGDGPSKNEIEELSRSMNLGDRVEFTGYQSFTRLPSYIEACQVGLIPHISTPHIETTMPNKIFQYMMLEKPVIVSSTRPMMRVVNDAGCGYIFQVDDENSLAATVLEVYRDTTRVQRGKKGKTAVLDRYNWSQTVRPLLDLYRHNLSRKTNIRKETA